LTPSKVRDAGKGAYGDGLGLWLMKDSKNVGRWAYRFQLDGKAHEMGLGSFRTFSLQEARAEALELRKLVKKGIDPLADRRARDLKKKLEAAAATTFADFAREYVETHRAGWSNAKHAAQWTQSLETYAFPVIGDLPIADVDTEAVKRVLLQPMDDGKTFWARFPETASRTRSRIEKILGAAAISKKRFGDNPAKWAGHLEHVLVSRAKREKGEEKHYPALPHSELPGVMAALREHEGIAARALELVILTASRMSEIRLAVWDEVNLPGRTMTIPAARVKTREAHAIPLSDRAVELLEAIRGEGVGYVFPGRGAPISDKSIREVLTSIRPGVSVHGMRACFRTWCAEMTEFERETAEAALGHRIGSKVERSYMRSKLFDRRRELMADWSAHCERVPGTVLKFGRMG
jgi:integrase